MPIGTVTITWKITTDVAGLIPATGKVRWHLPRVVLTDQAIAGLAPTPWANLVAGAGSIEIPDPWDPAIAPQGWTPEVEIESNALTARYPVFVPTGSAGKTLELRKLSTVPRVALGDIYALVNHTHAGGEGGGGGGGEDGPGGGEVSSVNGMTGDVVLTAADVGAVQPGQLAPVATAGTYASLTGKPTIPAAYADLTGLVPTSALPALAINDTFPVNSQAAMLALTAQRGDVAIRSDITAAFILATDSPTTLADWKRLPTPPDAVLSVQGQTGVIVLGKADIGLGNVVDLAPADLPVSDATQAALDTLEASVGGRIKAFATSGRRTVAIGPCNTSGAWTLCPAEYRVTIPAAVGDVLQWAPRLIAGVGGGDAELDVASVIGGTPTRFYSSGTTVQAPNGHGGLYLGGNYANGLNAINWVVTADDLNNGQITLALMYRAGGSGAQIGSNVYPGQIDVTNHGQAA